MKAYEERDKEQALEETFADASMDNLDRRWEEFSERELAEDWQASPCYPYTKVPTEPFFAIYLTKRQVAKLRFYVDVIDLNIIHGIMLFNIHVLYVQ